MSCALSRRGVAFAGAAIALSLATASAQDDAFERTRRGGAVTTFGTPAAQVCAESAAQGEVSDLAVDACTRALSEGLNRQGRVAMLINRGVLRLRRSEPGLALQDFDAAIELSPREAEAHQNRGAALIALGQNGPAVAALTEALGLGVQEPQKTYLNRGIAREALGDQRGALEDYTTALEIDPAWAPANAEIARIVRQRQERLARALEEPQAP